MPPAPGIDRRLPPHSTEAEAAALGCIFLDPVRCWPEFQEAFPEGEDAFYDLRHKTIYRAIAQSSLQGRFDVVTVVCLLRSKGEVIAAGGDQYLASLSDLTPSAANLPHYLSILKEKLTLRRVTSLCANATTEVYETPDVGQFLDRFERDALGIRRDGSIEEADIAATLDACVQDMEDWMKKPGITGLHTGFQAIDRMTMGLKPQEMIVLAARPSVGKTSMAMNIAEHVAVQDGVPVLIFSLEMSAKELLFRMVCSRACVDKFEAIFGNLTSSHIERLRDARIQIQRPKSIHIIDQAGLTINQIRAKARRMTSRHNIGLVIVDYVQLVRCSGSEDNLRVEVTRVSNGMKAMAKELGVPVIAISQLNRSPERDERHPRMSDLRESGALEQDADVVIILEPRGEPDDDGIQDVTAHVLKDRNGRVGPVDLKFNRKITKFFWVDPKASEPSSSRESALPSSRELFAH